jgi:predicted nucleic acid-binding protein
MPGVIVSDTSCLILLHKIGEFDLLKKLFGKLHITDTVSKELIERVLEKANES